MKRLMAVMAMLTCAVAVAQDKPNMKTEDWQRLRVMPGIEAAAPAGGVAAFSGTVRLVQLEWRPAEATVKPGDTLTITGVARAINGQMACDNYMTPVPCGGGSFASPYACASDANCTLFFAAPDCETATCGQNGVAIDWPMSFHPSVFHLMDMQPTDSDDWYRLWFPDDSQLDDINGNHVSSAYLTGWVALDRWVQAPPEGWEMFTLTFKVKDSAPAGVYFIRLFKANYVTPVYYDEINPGQNLSSEPWGMMKVTVEAVPGAPPTNESMLECVAACQTMDP